MNDSLGIPYLRLKGERVLSLEKPLVMAIVNITDDSFYAPSRATRETALERCLLAEQDGADIIDIGAESTRPGAAYVDADTELSRIVPLVKAFRERSALPLSIDTRKAAVAEAALAAGADIINDISALEDDPDLASVCAKTGAAVILMHKKGTPLDMQAHPEYEDAVGEITAYLAQAAKRATDAGIDPSRIALDPGVGFGKRPEDNLAIVARLAEIRRQGYPVLAGLSRKSFLGIVTGRDADQRLAATLAANYAALEGGADILRVHDVAETVDLVKVWVAVRGARKR